MAAGVQCPSKPGTRPICTHRFTVPGDTPTRAATCASVGSPGVLTGSSPGLATQQAGEERGFPMDRSLKSQPVSHSAPLHLRPTAELAERVLLPGDPGRALALAQSLLQAPRMFNHHRGLWGYTGEARDGELVTIQSTGMGGPSSAIVLSELIALGAARAIRVGTCGAVSGGLALGDLVIARESICADGTSRALGAGERVSADGPLS